MFLVLNKKTEEVLFVEPQVVEEIVDPKQLYASFSPKTMVAGWSTQTGLPEHFKITENGRIEELTLAEKIEIGVTQLEEGQTLVGTKVKEKTTAEKVADGTITLAPDERLSGNRIVELSVVEKVEQGLLTLHDTEKLQGGKIVRKTFEEQVAEGVMRIDAPFEYAKGNDIIKRSVQELLTQNLLKTKDEINRGLELWGTELQAELADKYKPSDEIKIMKNYLEWMEEWRTGVHTIQAEVLDSTAATEVKDLRKYLASSYKQLQSSSTKDARYKAFIEMSAFCKAVKEAKAPLRVQLEEMAKKAK